MEYILASRSPRRKQLLSLLLNRFSVEVSHFDEKNIREDDPEMLVKKLSYHKAKTVAVRHPDATVIGADTVVVSPEGRIFGIPENETQAKEMLLALSGKAHQVITGMTLFRNEIYHTFACRTKVFFRLLEEDEITAYIQSGEPFDKAGGYGIQGKAAVFVSKIEGDFYNVVGLPVAALYDALRKF